MDPCTPTMPRSPALKFLLLCSRMLAYLQTRALQVRTTSCTPQQYVYHAADAVGGVATGALWGRQHQGLRDRYMVDQTAVNYRCFRPTVALRPCEGTISKAYLYQPVQGYYHVRKLEFAEIKVMWFTLSVFSNAFQSKSCLCVHRMVKRAAASATYGSSILVPASPYGNRRSQGGDWYHHAAHFTSLWSWLWR